MISAFIDTGALAKTVAAAFISGVGITLIFSVAIYGMSRFAELGREGRNSAAIVYGSIGMVAGPRVRRGDRGRDNRHDLEMRTARNIAIILALAFVVAAVPAGDNVAEAVLTAISLAFMVVIGLAAYQIYRSQRLSIMALSDRDRGILVGAIGLIVLMIAGADELLDTGFGALIWIGLLAIAGVAIWRLWVESQTY